MNNKVFILIFIGAVFLIGAILYINNPEPVEYKNPNSSPNPEATSTEASANTCEANGFCVGPSSGSTNI